MANIAIREAQNQIAPLEVRSIDPETERNELPTEIDRVLRNMAGLTQGKSPTDPLIDLAKQYVLECSPERRSADPAPEKRLVDDVLLRIALGRRHGRELWYDTESGIPAMKWLKEEFQRLNNGRHPNFSLPSRIRVRLGRPLFHTRGLRIRLVDTRGIGESAIRPDLQQVLENPSSIMILASRFPSVPDDGVMAFWKHAHESQVPGIDERTLWLVLHHDDEALLLNRDDGTSVESLEEGCKVRESQMRPGMLKNHAEKTKIAFFNAAQETPESARTAIMERVLAVRGSYVRRLESLKEAFASLVNDPDKAALEQSHAEVRRKLRIFIRGQSELRTSKNRIEGRLLEQFGSSHHATIRACVNRDGKWTHLDVPLWLGEGAVDDARHRCRPAVDALKALLANMCLDESLAHARHTVEEIQASVDTLRADFLARVRDAGGIWYRSTSDEGDLWEGCQEEWQHGRGFKRRVIKRLEDWFSGDERDGLREMHNRRVEQAWKEFFVNPLSQLADTGADDLSPSSDESDNCAD